MSCLPWKASSALLLSTMRLVAAFFAALLLTLTTLAGQGCGRTVPASQAQTPATTSVAGKVAADAELRRAPAGGDIEAVPAAGACEAPDTQSDVEEDSAEALAARPDAVGLTTQSQARAGMPARAVPSPWPGELLRPPRTLHG
jgi:hypothetical protein